MKVLLITETCSEPGFADWEATLKREGVPYDCVITSPIPASDPPGCTSTLPSLSSTASDGTQVANYEGVVVADSGLDGLSTADWTTLQTFEHQISVRQITAYVYPSADYGLNAPTTSAGPPGSTPLSLTSDGSTVFPYLKGVALDSSVCKDLTSGATIPCQYGYEATPATGANVKTLVSGPNSSSLVGIYASSDGRETMYQTLDSNSLLLQSELLRHGELAWLARSTYFGDQRNYLETHIDDNFLPDDSYTPGSPAGTVGGGATDYNPADALREQPNDVTAAAAWSKANNFRIDMLYNGGGSTGNPTTDPLLAAFQANKNAFNGDGDSDATDRDEQCGHCVCGQRIGVDECALRHEHPHGARSLAGPAHDSRGSDRAQWPGTRYERCREAQGKITVSLACKATKGKTAKNKLCAGSFTLKIAGHKLGHRFRFRSPKTNRFTVTLSTKMMAAVTGARRHHQRRMVGSLLISTTQTHAKARVTRGALTIRV